MTCKPDNFDVISDFIDRLRQETDKYSELFLFSWHEVYRLSDKNEDDPRLEFIEGQISALERLKFVIDDLSDEFLARFPPT